MSSDGGRSRMSEKMIDEVFAFVRQVANCETSDQGNIRTARELVKRLESSATDPTSPQTAWMTMTEDQIKHMVDRFLGWKLPRDSFNPDCGISFDKKPFNVHTAHPSLYEPSGTNLFDATQADAMVRYMVAGMPSAPQRCSDETARESVGYQVPVGMKLVYVKRWRTIVPLPATHADEIVEALRPTSDGGVSEALALRLRDAAQTAQNDDLSRPISEKRDRHVIRVEAMLDAAEYLEEISAAASPHSRPHGECA